MEIKTGMFVKIIFDDNEEYQDHLEMLSNISFLIKDNKGWSNEYIEKLIDIIKKENNINDEGKPSVTLYNEQIGILANQIWTFCEMDTYRQHVENNLSKELLKLKKQIKYGNT